MKTEIWILCFPFLIVSGSTWYEQTVYAHEPLETVPEPEKRVYVRKQAMYEPERNIYEPKDVVYRPEKRVYKPKEAVYGPEEPVYGPEKTNFEAKDVYEPEKTVHEPNMAVYELHKNAHEPNMAIYEPHKPDHEPNMAVYEPHEPNMGAYEPHKPDHEPHMGVYEPHKTDHGTTMAVYASKTVLEPKMANYGPQQTVYEPYSQRAHQKMMYQKPKYKPVHKYSNRCFQCEYRPPKLRSYKIPVKEPYELKVPQTVYECQEEKVYYNQQPKGYGNDDYGHRNDDYGHRNDDYNPKLFGYERKCYPRTTYKIVKRYRTRYQTRTDKSPPGGFNACRGPIDKYSGRAAGVDDWKCHSNCFTRSDAYGNVQRGCYKGEFRVNPDLLGCHWQDGFNYCFCKGDHCNGGRVGSNSRQRQSGQGRGQGLGLRPH